MSRLTARVSHDHVYRSGRMDGRRGKRLDMVVLLTKEMDECARAVGGSLC